MQLNNIQTFRAFRSVNYTLYFFGRAISQFGTQMQRTAVVWVIYSITHSPFMIGLTLFAELFPSFLLSVLGGVVADRYDRYKIIKITQIASLIQAILLAVLVLTGHYIIWQILILSILLGIINAFDVPARQSMIHHVLTDPRDLPNAIALTSSMASLAKLLGPILAGITLQQLGAGICFLINAISFGGVLLSIFLMKLEPFSPPAVKKKIFTEFAEGFAYLREKPSIGFIILTISIVSLLVLPYDTLLPVFAKVIFHGDASTFGYISGFIGIGAFGGTVIIASLKPDTDLRKLLFQSMLLLGISLIAFAFTNDFALAMFIAILVGLGTVAQNTLTNIIVQSESSSEMKGRAISILIMALFGMLPLGSLLVGAISEQIGTSYTILIQGIIGLVIAAFFFRYLKTHRTPVHSADEELELEEPFVEEI